MGYTLHGRYRRKEVQTVSYMVARMQKMKADNLVGIGNHNQRKTDNHSNKDIDAQRSHLNYDLVEGRTENYKTDIQNFIEEKKSGTRATRKDAVLVNEWIITSDRPFFENKDDKEVERFFTTAKDYFADKFGDDNIRYAQVHLDETTPHMHLGVVPFDENNKLSAKRVFNRAALIEIQDELPIFMQDRGFDVQRGEKGSERKNLTVPEYKAFKEEKRALEFEMDGLKQDLATTEDQVAKRKQEIQSLRGGKPLRLDMKKLEVRHETKDVKVPTGEKIFGIEKKEVKKQKTGNIILSEAKFEQVVKNYEEFAKVYQSVEKYIETDVVHEHQQLADMVTHNANIARRTFDKLDIAQEEISELKEENKTLKQQVQTLKNEISRIYQSVKELFLKGLEGDLRRVRGVMNTFTQDVNKNAHRGEFSRLNENENEQVRKRSRGRSR